mmetsp:Transcript_51377/g.143628  ORF Transcript_51377/g.143628 Transcript_51377/m.143628 type:complete len:244 (-) Transcript_51377:144-875(-)
MLRAVLCGAVFVVGRSAERARRSQAPEWCLLPATQEAHHPAECGICTLHSRWHVVHEGSVGRCRIRHEARDGDVRGNALRVRIRECRGIRFVLGMAFPLVGLPDNPGRQAAEELHRKRRGRRRCVHDVTERRLVEHALRYLSCFQNELVVVGVNFEDEVGLEDVNSDGQQRHRQSADPEKRGRRHVVRDPVHERVDRSLFAVAHDEDDVQGVGRKQRRDHDPIPRSRDERHAVVHRDDQPRVD